MTEIVTAHALQDETAARIRERGTKFFRKAVVADDCETEHNYLRTALALYEEALDASSPAGAERARAHKNISATHNALFRHPDQHKFQRVLSAVTHAADALEAARLASDDLSPSWKEDVKSKFLALLCFVKHARGNSAEAQKTALVRQASKRVRDLPRGIDGKGEACGILATFNAGVIATNGMQEAGVVTACAIPQQLFAEATQLALDGESEGYHIEPDDLGEYADRVLHDGSFTGAVYQMQCLCESTRLRFLGEREALVAEHAVENGKEPNQDRVMNVAVDNLKAAILEARGRDSECEGRASEVLGGIFTRIVPLPDLASKYYYDAVTAALASQGRNFGGEDWYRRACVAAMEYQRKREREIAENFHKLREPALARLKATLLAMETAARTSWQALLAFLYKEMPPAPSKLGDYVLPEKMTADQGKKLLMKAISHYHSDLQNDRVCAEPAIRERWGDDWKVLCEEIVKLLNRANGCFKHDPSRSTSVEPPKPAETEPKTETETETEPKTETDTKTETETETETRTERETTPQEETPDPPVAEAETPPKKPRSRRRARRPASKPSKKSRSLSPSKGDAV